MKQNIQSKPEKINKLLNFLYPYHFQIHPIIFKMPYLKFVSIMKLITCTQELTFFNRLNSNLKWKDPTNVNTQTVTRSSPQGSPLGDMLLPIRLQSSLYAWFATKSLLYLSTWKNTRTFILDKSHSDAHMKDALRPSDKQASYRCTRSSTRTRSSLSRK